MIVSGNVCGLKIYVFIEEFDFKLKDNNRFIYWCVHYAFEVHA